MITISKIKGNINRPTPTIKQYLISIWKRLHLPLLTYRKKNGKRNAPIFWGVFIFKFFFSFSQHFYFFFCLFQSHFNTTHHIFLPYKYFFVVIWLLLLFLFVWSIWRVCMRKVGNKYEKFAETIFFKYFYIVQNHFSCFLFCFHVFFSSSYKVCVCVCLCACCFHCFPSIYRFFFSSSTLFILTKHLAAQIVTMCVLDTLFVFTCVYVVPKYTHEHDFYVLSLLNLCVFVCTSIFFFLLYFYHFYSFEWLRFFSCLSVAWLTLLVYTIRICVICIYARLRVIVHD